MKSEYIFKAAWLDGVEELNDKEELNLRRWIDDYALRRVEPDPAEIAASRALLRLKWEAIRKELHVSRVRSECGKKGGRKKGSPKVENAVLLEAKQEAKVEALLEAKNNQKDDKKALLEAKYEPNLPSPRARVIDTTINEVNLKEKAHISGASPREADVCVQSEPEGSNEALAKLEDEFNRYTGWLRRDYPYYADPENCEVLTLYQWHRLRQDFDLETIARATEDLDARADYKRRGQVGSHFTYLRSFCENIKAKKR